MLTNNKELSVGLFNALSYDSYTKGDCDFSATELLSPPRIIRLKSLFKDQVQEDASDVIYRILGRAVHSLAENARAELAGDNSVKRNKEIKKILERISSWEIPLENIVSELEKAVKKADTEAVFEKHKILFEKRFFADIEVDGVTVKISGQIDQFNLETGEISDYKLTSRWVAIDNGKDEWTQQQNIYAWLLYKNGYKATKAYIEAIFRDWSKSQAARDSSYPQSQVQSFPIELWDLNKTEAFIKDRVRQHLEARKQTDELKLEVCSSEDRWERPATFAVRKKGRDRALRVLDTNAEAITWIAQHKKEGEVLTIENRPGESVRCKMYCPVSEVCSYKKLFVQ